MSMRYAAGFISAFYNPLKNPNAPTIGTATGGVSSVSISFTAPSDVGGSAITSYIATAKRTSDGVLFTASGASSPITVTGLTAVAFTVTVVAVNSYGPSAPSAASNSATPLAIGSALGGGFFAGQISTAGNGIATHNLIVGPVASAQSTLQWKTSNTSTTGTSSVIDGPTNSANMNNSSHPAAQFCEGLTIGGFSDWYMPAKNELEVCYYNLKPVISSNNTSSGINANAVPARASNYTSGTPAQTSATDFQDTGSEDFATAGTAGFYWSSTENNSSTSWFQYFYNGDQNNLAKNFASAKVRAVRRVAV